jgi:hypothetical protein
VHEKPDLILAACCAASLILAPLFVIGTTVVLFSIAVAGEIAGRVRGREAGLVDTRTYERFALKATALGVRTAFVNQPIEVPAVCSQFAEWLGIGSRRPDLVVRLGRGPFNVFAKRIVRKFWGTRSCSVVLRRAPGSICSGHPESEVVNNQSVAIVKNPNLVVPRASNQGVRGSNPFGRIFHQKSSSAARATRSETSRSNP